MTGFFKYKNGMEWDQLESLLIQDILIFYAPPSEHVGPQGEEPHAQQSYGEEHSKKTEFTESYWLLNNSPFIKSIATNQKKLRVHYSRER